MDYERIDKDEKAIKALQAQTTGGIGALTSLTDSSGGATGNDTLAAVTLNHTLTDNSAGTPSTSAIAALADGTTYSSDVAAIRNNFATIAAELALIRTALSTNRDNVADVAAKVNAVIGAV